MYQGHLADGSSIQRHSAGSHYPMVVGVQEGRDDKWFVMAPTGDTDFFFDGDIAYAAAQSAADARTAQASR